MEQRVHRQRTRNTLWKVLPVLCIAWTLVAGCGRGAAPAETEQPPAPTMAQAEQPPTENLAAPSETTPSSVSDGNDRAAGDVAYIRALETVNLRSGPGMEHAILGEVAAGQFAQVTGASADGAWWRVLCPDGTTGECYVSADPALTEPAQPLGPAVETNVQYVTVQVDTPIYKGMPPDHTIIGAVFSGQTARVTGKSPDSAWWRVLCPDDSVGECYIAANAATVQPTTGPGTPYVVLDAPVSLVLAQSDVAMHAFPDENEPVIGSIAGGMTAQVTGVSGDGSWWRVICPDGTIGSCWVSADPALTVPATP
jgi:uncharacterized protein YraI